MNSKAEWGTEGAEDLVWRLRKGRSANEWVSEELAKEAADEIEGLRRQLRDERGRNSILKDTIARKNASLDQATAKIAVLATVIERLNPQEQRP